MDAAKLRELGVSPDDPMQPVGFGLTHDDLLALPYDGYQHELIDGVHWVRGRGDEMSPAAPNRRHQAVGLRLARHLDEWAESTGGLAYPAAVDVRFADAVTLQPDVVALSPEQAARLRDPRFIDVVPDLVVEISSQSTRVHDLSRKKATYEANGVPEFWFVDLDADRVEVHVLDATGRYPLPTLHRDGDLTATSLDGFTIAVRRILDAH